MADFSETIKTLEQQRQQMLDQVAAIDRAIAALRGIDRPGRAMSAATTAAATAAPAAAAPAARAAAKPKRKRQFKLSEEHKRKLLEGQRRAREARLAGNGRANNNAPAAVPSAPASEPLPRLVKPDGSVIAGRAVHES